MTALIFKLPYNDFLRLFNYLLRYNHLKEILNKQISSLILSPLNLKLTKNNAENFLNVLEKALKVISFIRSQQEEFRGNLRRLNEKIQTELQKMKSKIDSKLVVAILDKLSHFNLLYQEKLVFTKEMQAFLFEQLREEVQLSQDIYHFLIDSLELEHLEEPLNDLLTLNLFNIYQKGGNSGLILLLKKTTNQSENDQLSFRIKLANLILTFTSEIQQNLKKNVSKKITKFLQSIPKQEGPIREQFQ